MEAWGKLTSIDLKLCNADKIKSKEEIQNYIEKLCSLINMKKLGESKIAHFGKNKKLEGYSFIQLIETSSITGHFANDSRSAYIDIFSCANYSGKIASEFSKLFFEAKKMDFHILNRY